MKEPTTDHVVVNPVVVAKVFVMQARRRQNEVGALLLGRIEGKSLFVEDIGPFVVGSAAAVDFKPQDFENTLAKARPGQYIVGWAHGHPTYGAFLSATDVRHQQEGQGLFPDYVALVLDPHRADGAHFQFFRVEDQRARHVEHSYGRKRWNTSDKPLSQDGTKKRFARVRQAWSAVVRSGPK